jgi:heavy metal efflux system protein
MMSMLCGAMLPKRDCTGVRYDIQQAKSDHWSGNICSQCDHRDRRHFDWTIKVDRDKAARYGLNTGDVNTVIQAALGGTVATTQLEGDRQFGVRVRVAEQYRNSLESVGNIKVGYTNAVAEAQDRIKRNVPLPTGYRIIWAGEFEDLEAATARLEVIVPISLVLILVLLYGLFNSLRDSLLALAGIPFAVAGGVVALYFSGLDLSVSAAIGFVSLFGVSVMDGILMITYYNTVMASGMETVEAMFHVAEQRMRPMLMTALSACIGLFPAAISTGIGSQVQRPLATVVVGGMLIGPIMLLVVVPALRMLFLGREGDRVNQIGAGGVAPAE